MEPSHCAGTDAIAKQEAVAARLIEMGVSADRAFCTAKALKYFERCGRERGASAADDMGKAADYLFRAISGRWPWEGAVETDPVLAADGLPLREGEHVYHVETGAELVVKELPKPGAYQAVVVFAPPAGHLTSFDPDRLTHQRPASKVLDADGVEIRVGDIVYHVKDGSEMTVYGIEGEWLVVGVGGRARHDIVTHRAPVLAADGKPLREGETVWGTGREQHEYIVLGQPGLGGGAGRFKVTCHDVTDDVACYCDPSQLTHELPRQLGAAGGGRQRSRLHLLRSKLQVLRELRAQLVGMRLRQGSRPRAPRPRAGREGD